MTKKHSIYLLNLELEYITNSKCITTLMNENEETMYIKEIIRLIEIKAGYEILGSLGIRSRGVQIISCPSCARQAFPVIETVKLLEKRLSHIKEPLTVSVIGCVVNGPGEALKSEIGVTGGGKGNSMIYLSGLADHKITNPEIVDHVVNLVEKKLNSKND